jgi:hypothetical protein
VGVEVGSEGWNHQDVLSSTGIFDVTFESDKTSSNTSGICFGESNKSSSGSESLQDSGRLDGTTISEPGAMGNEKLSTTTRSEPPKLRTRKRTTKKKSKPSPAPEDTKDKVVRKGRKLKEPTKAKVEEKGKKEEAAKSVKVTKPRQKKALLEVNKMSTIAEVNSPIAGPCKANTSAEEKKAVQTKSKVVKKKVVPTKGSAVNIEGSPKVLLKEAVKPKNDSEGTSKKTAGGKATKVNNKTGGKTEKATLVKKGRPKKAVKSVNESETTLSESEDTSLGAAEETSRGNNSSQFNSSATTGGTSSCDSSLLNSTSDTLGSMPSTSSAGEGSDGGEAERNWRESQSCSRVISKMPSNVHPGRRSGIFSPPKNLSSPLLGVVQEEEEDNHSPLTSFPPPNLTVAPLQVGKDRRRTYVINIAMALDLDEEKESAVAQLIENNPNVKVEPATPKKPNQKGKGSKKEDSNKGSKKGGSNKGSKKGDSNKGRINSRRQSE